MGIIYRPGSKEALIQASRAADESWAWRAMSPEQKITASRNWESQDAWEAMNNDQRYNLAQAAASDPEIIARLASPAPRVNPLDAGLNWYQNSNFVPNANPNWFDIQKASVQAPANFGMSVTGPVSEDEWAVQAAMNLARRGY